MPEVRLIPVCPRCGSCNVKESASRKDNPYRYLYIVQCQTCGFDVTSPIRRNDARERWNSFHEEDDNATNQRKKE